LALTGRESGPEMAALLPLIGRDETVARLRAASDLLRHPEPVSGSNSPPPGRMTSWALKQFQGDAALYIPPELFLLCDIVT
jgi:hypothetical protein